MAETTNNHPDHGHGDVNPQVSHERRDIDVFQVTAFGIGVLIAFFVAVGAMWALWHFYYSREDAKNVSNPYASMSKEKQREFPEPRLQSKPRTELRELREDEDAILNGYGWVDPNKNIVRIPIETAINMVAAKGLPYKGSPAGTDHDGYRMIPQDSSSGRTLEKISQ